MAVKYSTPEIRFREIDNTIRTEAEPGFGIGAIVLKANKGPVNMRVMTRNYQEFKNIFGAPENLDDYGHFGAENYLAQANQLWGVRATMGDEEYAQIQYAYPDASTSAQNLSDDEAVFKYVNNEAENQLKMVQPVSAAIVIDTLINKDQPENAEWLETDARGFALNKTASWANIEDIKTEQVETIIFKDGPNNISETGKHIIYPSLVNTSADILKVDQKLMLLQDAWENRGLTVDQVQINSSIIQDDQSEFRNHQGQKITFTIPGYDTMDGANYRVSFIADKGWIDEKLVKGTDHSAKYEEFFSSDAFYPSGHFDKFEDNIAYETAGYGIFDAKKLQLLDWDDVSTKKTYYVDDDKDIHLISDASGKAEAIYFREYGRQEDSYALVGEYDLDGSETTERDETMYVSAFSGIYNSKEEWMPFEHKSPKKLCIDMASDYGFSDVSDLMKYYYLRYFDIKEQEVIEKVIKEDISKAKDETGKYIHKTDKLFWMYSDTGSYNTTIVSVFKARNPEQAALPIQSDFQYETEGKLSTGETVKVITKVNPIVAQPSSNLFNSVDKTYADGYTLETQTEDEPGIGDLENYRSNFDNQLVIGSIGPGKYGNDIGISIITAEASEIPALWHRNAFNWKYTYDDEDQVDEDTQDWRENDADLTWKKVYRINVYAKTSTQTAKLAWGTGMDAMLKDPIESWLVSNDPYAKDSEGNSLYAPTKINGHSDYIYVSRSSVTAARNGKGQYEQPLQTYGIYQLTGGKNSTKNIIKEKTAALSLYNDVQKADLDILFNVETIESFGAKAQKYIGHERTIAQIAQDRTMDIGVIQVTAKDSKTAKAMVADSKSFSFANGTYVAMYGGYDKYYNSDIGAWIYLPKSVAGACAMAYCDMNYYPWRAPAGVQCGQIPYTHGQLKQLTDNEIGELYDACVNTSRDCGNVYGELLWGQKTALKKTSALNRINVRRCLNYIEKQLKNALTPYLFQQNTANTRASAKNVIDSFLDRVKAGEGIISYSTSVTQDEGDEHIMNVDIKLVPAEAIEFIDVKIYVNRNNQTVGVVEA